MLLRPAGSESSQLAADSAISDSPQGKIEGSFSHESGSEKQAFASVLKSIQNRSARFELNPRATGSAALGSARKRGGSGFVETESDKRAYDRLVEQQAESLPTAKHELAVYKKKRSHWAWYAFPTAMAGTCDFECTRVTSTSAVRLCHEQRTAESWREVLELVCDLVEEKGQGVLPIIDHGRIKHFILFWKSVEDAPPWMKNVCERLDEFHWKEF